MVNLTGSAKTIEAEADAVDSIPVLAEALRQENEGQGRQTVKTALNARLGALVVAQMPADADAAVEVPAPPASSSNATQVSVPKTTDGAKAPEQADIAIAQLGDRTVEETTDAFADVAGAQRNDPLDQMNVTHRTAATVILYKPTLNMQGEIMPGMWRPVNVRATNMKDAYSHGFQSECPDCHGNCTAEINSCPAKQRLFARCPEPSCRRRIPDTYSEALGVVDVDDSEVDPNEMVYELSDLTPEQRVKSKVDDHLRAFHPAAARARGLKYDEGLRSETKPESNKVPV